MLVYLVSIANIISESNTKHNEYTAIIKHVDDYWVGWIDVPGVNCQEKSYEELKDTLEITLKEALEFNRQDAHAAADSGYELIKIAI